jgi:hypothetical protein
MEAALSSPPPPLLSPHRPPAPPTPAHHHRHANQLHQTARARLSRIRILPEGHTRDSFTQTDMPWFLRRRAGGEGGGGGPGAQQLPGGGLTSRPLLDTPTPPALSLQHLVRGGRGGGEPPGRGGGSEGQRERQTRPRRLASVSAKPTQTVVLSLFRATNTNPSLTPSPPLANPRPRHPKHTHTQLQESAVDAYRQPAW